MANIEWLTQYKVVLGQTQRYVTENYTKALTRSEDMNEEAFKSYIEKYIDEQKIEFENFPKYSLIHRMYNDMSQYSIITDYLKDPSIEEININNWEDIKYTNSQGNIVKIKETFLSPVQAEDVIKRLLQQQSESIMDKATPVVRGHLANNIRITTVIPPVLDDERGVMASIRMINPQKLQKEDFIELGTTTEEMFSFLALCLQSNISVCMTGATNSGKTTLMGSILSEIDDHKRIITIENETREFDLIKRDEKNNIINNVIHWVTYGDINQEKLLEFALTSNPDIICVAEMKSSEAYAAQEASRTGHGVITTIHATSCRATYSRMVTLCKLKAEMDYDTLYSLVAEAFPIVVYTKKLGDNTRKIMEITECCIDDNGKTSMQTLYRYDILENTMDEKGDIKINGKFIKENRMSESLKRRFLENGIASDQLEILERMKE